MKLINVTTHGSLQFRLDDNRIAVSCNSGYIRINTHNRNMFNGLKVFYQMRKQKIMCPRKRYKFIKDFNSRICTK